MISSHRVYVLSLGSIWSHILLVQREYTVPYTLGPEGIYGPVYIFQMFIILVYYAKNNYESSPGLPCAGWRIRGYQLQGWKFRGGLAGWLEVEGRPAG